MTAPWGPALDAEVAYRHEQLRAQFGRRRRAGRRQATEPTEPVGTTEAVGPAVAAAARPAASVDTIGRIPPQRTVTTEPDAAAAGDRAGRRAA